MFLRVFFIFIFFVFAACCPLSLKFCEMAQHTEMPLLIFIFESEQVSVCRSLAAYFEFPTPATRVMFNLKQWRSTEILFLKQWIETRKSYRRRRRGSEEKKQRKKRRAPLQNWMNSNLNSNEKQKATKNNEKKLKTWRTRRRFFFFAARLGFVRLCTELKFNRIHKRRQREQRQPTAVAAATAKKQDHARIIDRIALPKYL